MNLRNDNAGVVVFLVLGLFPFAVGLLRRPLFRRLYTAAAGCVGYAMSLGAVRERGGAILVMLGWGILSYFAGYIGQSTAEQISEKRKRNATDHLPRCGHCGYLLIGMHGSDCPECGRPFSNDVTATLPQRWRAFCNRCHAQNDVDVVYRVLTNCYREPRRRYHNLAHIGLCLQTLDRFEHLAADPLAVEGALWFHDAIYIPGRPDNEAASADLADRYLRYLKIDQELLAALRVNILATHHRTPPAAADAALTADIDLSILGQPPAVYDTYAKAIEAEAALPPDDFRTKRAAFLRTMLARERLFHTLAFVTAFELQARANLKRELEALTS